MEEAPSCQCFEDRLALYSSVGAELTHYEVDVEGAALVRPQFGGAARERPVLVAPGVALAQTSHCMLITDGLFAP